MIKKMRNKMLLMSMISIFCLIVVAFSAIYAITYNHMEQNIHAALERTYSFHRPGRFRFQSPDFKPENAEKSEKLQRALKDISNFSVFVDKEGNVHTDSMLGENSKHYEEVAKVALNQNASDGEFVSEDVIWRFRTREIKDGAKIIALVDITAEKGMLRQLIISFGASAFMLLAIIFFISLLFSNRAMRPVSEAWDKQKQFVADASHELKTPLTAINANIDVLLSKSENKIKDEEKWLRYVQAEVQRLSELTGNLLFMAKMDADVPTVRVRTSISEIVESAVLNFEAVAFEKGIKIEADIEHDVYGMVDSSQITRLVLILLDNAIKYSPKNEIVYVSLKKQGKEHFELSVRNTGSVIGQENIEKIFDRFYRVDESRSTSGYGLGLSMAKEIVKSHKGKINVKSSQENTAEFIITF